MAFSGLVRSERRRLPSSRHASTTCGFIPALARMSKKPPASWTRRRECTSLEPRSARSTRARSEAGSGKNACALVVSGGRTTVVGASPSRSMGVWSATAAGLTPLKRPGNTSRKPSWRAKALPSCRTRWRTAAQARPLAQPSTLSVMSPMSREVMVRATSAKRALATWLEKALEVMVVPHKALKLRGKSANVSTGWRAQVAVRARPKRHGVMMRCRRQNFASVPQALSRGSENTHWNLSATMRSCPWSIWDSFRCLSSNIHKRSFGWIAIKIHSKINYLKVPTYDPTLSWQRSDGKPLTNLGVSLALLKDDSGNSLERRFVVLLNAHADDLPEHLRQAISLLKSKDKPIHWLRLLLDLKQWDREDRRVQRLWAKGFWGEAVEDD